MFTDCLKYQKQLYSYVDGNLPAEAAALFEQHIQSCANCAFMLQEARDLEASLRGVLIPMEPPQDFSARVMAALPLRETVFEKPVPKVFRLPRRAAFAGLGTLAAAVALVIGIYGMGESLPQNPVDIAEKPSVITEPNLPPTKNNGGAVTDPVPNATPNTNDLQNNGEAPPVATNTQNPNGTVTEKPTTQKPNTGTAQPNTSAPSGEGTSMLPQASFGKEAVGNLHIRLAATYDKTNIYGLHLASKNELGFYTYENEELALWHVSAANATEPECLTLLGAKNERELASVLQNACPSYSVNTVLFSPDKSLQASNVRGENAGLWVSGALLDKPFLLTPDAGGSLLAWSPNGSKLLFTDASGGLYVGYPLEEQVFKIYDQPVNDVLWLGDNQTIAFLAKESGKSYNSLFTAKLP